MSQDTNALATRSQSFFDNHGSQSFAPLLSEIEKRDLAEQNIAFEIVKIRQSNTKKHGDCWALDIDLGGMVRGILFSRGKGSDANRDEMFDAMVLELDEMGPIAAVLTVTQTNQGYDFYNLVAPNQDQLAILGSGDDVPF